MGFCKLDLYRIRSHVWVHGSIGHCHPARDGKVKLSYICPHCQHHFYQKLFPCPDCPVLEGFTVRVMPLQTPPLSPGFTFFFQLQKTQDCCVPILRPTLQKRTCKTYDQSHWLCLSNFLFSGWTKRMSHSQLWWRISDLVYLRYESIFQFYSITLFHLYGLR